MHVTSQVCFPLQQELLPPYQITRQLRTSRKTLAINFVNNV
jgi:hypothetical protein